MSISRLGDIREASCALWQNGMGWGMGPVLAIHGDNGACVAIATATWHADYDDPVTWPAMQDHEEGWLALCGYGDYPPNSNIVKTVVSEWLADADLSPLDDNDDDSGHRRLASSLMASIQLAQDRRAVRV